MNMNNNVEFMYIATDLSR